MEVKYNFEDIAEVFEGLNKYFKDIDAGYCIYLTNKEIYWKSENLTTSRNIDCEYLKNIYIVYKTGGAEALEDYLFNTWIP